MNSIKLFKSGLIRRKRERDLPLKIQLVIFVHIYYEVRKGHMRSVSIELFISYEIDRLYVRRVSSRSVPRRISPCFLL